MTWERKERVVVVKRFGRWIGSCPWCPPRADTGFVDHEVHGLVLAWAVTHADRHRKQAVQYVETTWLSPWHSVVRNGTQCG